MVGSAASQQEGWGFQPSWGPGGQGAGTSARGSNQRHTLTWRERWLWPTPAAGRCMGTAWNPVCPRWRPTGERVWTVTTRRAAVGSLAGLDQVSLTRAGARRPQCRCCESTRDRPDPPFSSRRTSMRSFTRGVHLESWYVCSLTRSFRSAFLAFLDVAWREATVCWSNRLETSRQAAPS